MKCPECVAAGMKSKLYEGQITIKAVFTQPYYDEEGVWHPAPPPPSETDYRCSNGHTFTIKHGQGVNQ